MELSALAKRLNVTNRRCVDKAKEYQRLAQRKSGVGSVPSSVEATSVACIELGCRFHQVEVDAALCLKYSICKTPLAYSKVLSSLSQVLGLRATVNTRDLAVQFGCIQANDLARKVLQAYKEHSSSAAADLRDVFPCVAFYLSCKQLKIVGVDRKRLVTLAAVSEKEFVRIIDTFYQCIPELKPPERKPSAAKGQKRKKTDAAAAGDDAEGQEEDEQKDSADADGDAPSDAESDDGIPRRVTKAPRDESKNFLQPIAKRHKGISSASSSSAAASTSASPDASDAAVANSFLRQAKLNFGAAAAAGSSSSRSQLRMDPPPDEGEAELE